MKIPQPSRQWLVPGLFVGLVALLLGAGAAAAFESDTVGSYWRGLWWAISLMTTVGFVGQTRAPWRAPWSRWC
jgi:voltage-gated potassium channel